MGCFRVQYTALILSIGVINGESWEESCLNPNTEEQCSGNGICREEYDEGGTYNQCRCFSSEYRPPWFGPDEWSKVSTQYRGLSGKWCQCKRENCPGKERFTQKLDTGVFIFLPNRVRNHEKIRARFSCTIFVQERTNFFIRARISWQN